MDEVEASETALGIERSADARGDTVLTLRGELDISSADTFRGTVEEIVAEGPGRLVFDLSGLTFMDSSGIAVMVYAANNVGDRRAAPFVEHHPAGRGGDGSRRRPPTGAVVMFEARFPGVPQSVAGARRFAAGALSGVPGEVADAVALIASELATNSVRHAGIGVRGPCRAVPRPDPHRGRRQRGRRAGHQGDGPGRHVGAGAPDREAWPSNGACPQGADRGRRCGPRSPSGRKTTRRFTQRKPTEAGSGRAAHAEPVPRHRTQACPPSAAGAALVNEAVG